MTIIMIVMMLKMIGVNDDVNNFSVYRDYIIVIIIIIIIIIIILYWFLYFRGKIKALAYGVIFIHVS